ncbi:hypothetical protein ACHAWO_003952 [Cyclotella atomus]|uniref:Uncharacterized protein n=1 Tax=Cyclotella atomus TaxID=382360 RepID=A0ABD3NL94_9STRA
MKANTSPMEVSDSWTSRVKEALGGPFKPQMTRAVILLAICEARRIMVNTNEAWPTLRPFQRKIAILHTALDLIYTLDFISDEDKSRIVSLAPKNKPDAKPIIARMALHRAEGLETEIQNKILGGIEKLMGEEMTHDEVCDAYVQNLFEEVTGKTGPHPPCWIFHRKPIFLVYRVYYQGLNVDSNLFETKAPRAVELPHSKPACLAAYVFSVWCPVHENLANRAVLDMNVEDCTEIQNSFVGHVTMEENDAGVGTEMKSNKKDAKMCYKSLLQHLMGLKLRLDLLNEVGCDDEGFTQDEIKSEKTKIFAALPPFAPVIAKTNRVDIMETKLRLQILQDLKKSNVFTRQCTKMMKAMFIGMAPLKVVEASIIGAKNRKANRLARKAARLDEQDANKKNVAAQTDLKMDDKVGNEKPIDEGWEVLDGMDDVNASVAGISMNS